MKLSDCHALGTIERDASFERLGSADAHCTDLLAYADTVKHLHKALANPGLAAVITTAELADQVPARIGLMLCSAPREAFFAIHRRFINESLYRWPFDPGIGQGCRIHPSAQIAPGCRIGDHVTIAEQVVVRESVWIGSHVTLEAGAKIGMEGILYHRTAAGPRLIPHGGCVRIHDHAMVMANAVVVRSVHDTEVTEIGNSALIGLGSIVGHDARVGAAAVVSNQCVIARGASIGERAFLGTQSMIKEYTRIGEDAKVMAGSVVIGDVAPGATVSGNFATEHGTRMLDHMRSQRRASSSLPRAMP